MARTVSAQEEDIEKCRLYREFYQDSIGNKKLVTLTGETTVEYWRQARLYVEPKIRAWRIGRSRE